jgi:hypothetical protein
VKADERLGARLSARQTHGYRPLKRAVRVLGTRAVDRRTRIGKALDAWRADLIADLGGLDQLSKQEQAILEEAVLTKLILSSINVWLLEQPSLVNGRTRGVLPVVLHRNALVTTLRGLLVDLGLKRRTRELPPIADYLKAAGPAPLQREGAGLEPQGSSPRRAPLPPHDGEP